MTDIDATISTYLTAITIEGKTPKTIHSYANSLSDFRRTGAKLELPGTVADYRVEHVYRFLGALRERGASAAYQHRRHREVKAFFSWCRRIGEVEVNAFQQVPLVRLEQKVVQPFTQEDVADLLKVLDRRRYTGCRNYALLLFLLDTGVRASECLTVELKDIDEAHSRVLIRHGKGLKQRWVGIGERAQRAVRDYIERFRGELPSELFLTARGDAMSSVGTLEVILRRVGKHAGVAKVHPHRFRHTFATWAIQSGAREIDVQLLLGHADLTMTQRYARTYSSAQAVRAHARLSPVGQLEPVGEQPESELSALHQPSLGLPWLAAEEALLSGVAANSQNHGGRPEFRAGQTLVATHKGERFVCKVVDDNGRAIFVRPSGERFASPSAAGRSVTGNQVNGYRFWSVL